LALFSDEKQRVHIIMSLEYFKKTLKMKLNERGALNRIKAQIRAEIFNTLQSEQASSTKTTDDSIIVEQLLINELIKEYLEWNGYNHALNVFLKESNQQKELSQRKFLESELGIKNITDKEQDLYVSTCDNYLTIILTFYKTTIIYNCSKRAEASVFNR
jgi:lisH domain-containing protein FOPNL